MTSTRAKAPAMACAGLLALLLGLGTLPGCGGDESSAGSATALAGSWHVDKEHYRRLLLDDLGGDGVTDGRPDHASIGLLLAQLRLVLVLSEDGTWTLKGGVGMDPVDDAGTWSADGETLILRFTQQRGRPITKTVMGKIAPDGSLHVRPSPGQPGAFRLVRR